MIESSLSVSSLSESSVSESGCAFLTTGDCAFLTAVDLTDDFLFFDDDDVLDDCTAFFVGVFKTRILFRGDTLDDSSSELMEYIYSVFSWTNPLILFLDKLLSND